MESRKRTPLGFIPGDVETQSHCMYCYRKRDETYIRNVADFLAAGLRVGEKSICVLDQPYADQVKDMMRSMGLYTGEAPRESQLAILSYQDLIPIHGVFDTQDLLRFRENWLSPAQARWCGVRLFVSTVPMMESRIGRFKYLEIEALTNTRMISNLMVCAYDMTLGGRSFRNQAADCHVFIANSRSIRRNPDYMHPSEFLSGFYRFRMTSKDYPASALTADELGLDVVEVGLRTPLTVARIYQLRAAAVGVFAHIAQRRTDIGMGERGGGRVHVAFNAESDKLVVSIRDRHEYGEALVNPECYESSARPMADGQAGEVSVRILPGEVTVTLVRRYLTAPTESPMLYQGPEEGG